MTKRNNHNGSSNQSAPEKGGRLDTEFGIELSSGDNNKGNDYNSRRGSKSKKIHQTE